jgi:peptide/nickel transport system substrate-binding protein
MAAKSSSNKQLVRQLDTRGQSAVKFGRKADKHLEELLINRFDRLVDVKRFVVLWICLFLFLFFATVAQFRALTPYYKTLHPVAGGIYSEGVVGNFSNANPLYASSSADSAVSRLVFSGLFKYDVNNKLIGDLAKDYQLNKDQTVYTVHLKDGIKWHDGEKFTADDVLFTYHAIQNVESQSSLYANWQDIKVQKVNDSIITFELPNALSSFPHSLINGIIPVHKFKAVSPLQMRSNEFNTAPVGTGPFEWKFVEVTGSSLDERRQHISLSAFGDYWAGKPKLGGFSLTTFNSEEQLLAAFDKKQLNAISGIETVPERLATSNKFRVYKTPSTSEAMAFFNMSSPLLMDKDLRKALVSGVDKNQLNKVLGYGVNLVDSPLLPGQLGYSSSIVQPGYNLLAAKKTLDEAGWKEGQDGFRSKDGQPLKFTMTSQNTQEYTLVAGFLQKQWKQLGVKLSVNYYSGDDLQATVIANHDYEILLYAINIGVDPDVFAYWDSTQISPDSQGHLNLSEYKSTMVDQALEAARTRDDSKIRKEKYKKFLATWVEDSPALALYQPNIFYLTRGAVYNYERKSTNNTADRYYNVHNWMIRQRY